MSASLPSDAKERKAAPMAEGLLWYFPNALAEVARVSKAGNDQHNPGQSMHHSRGRSIDHADCIMRHLVDAGTVDSDGQRHSAKVAWRALALLQEELERETGVPLPRNARLPEERIKVGMYADDGALLGYVGADSKAAAHEHAPVDNSETVDYTTVVGCARRFRSECIMPLRRNPDGSLSVAGTADAFARDDQASGV